MKQAVVDIKKERVGEVELPEAIFGVTDKVGLLYEQVRMQRANRRSGTAATKNTALVSGTGAKMYKQKGTGRARHGSFKRNIFVGGGTAFGPMPRDYHYEMPKKARKRALAALLSEKVREEKLMVLDDLSLSSIKTKVFVETLKGLGIESGLIVVEALNKNIFLSARNIPWVKVVSADRLSALDLLRFETTVVTKAALPLVVAKGSV